MATGINRAVREFDFANFLSDYGVDMHSRSTGELAGICPFCNWKRVSFYVDPTNGLYFCHACLEKGGPVRLIQKVMQCSYPRAIELLTNNFNFFVKDEEEEELQEVAVKTIELPEGFFPLDGNDGNTAKPYREYAYGRGIDDDMIRAYNIGFCVTGRYASRLIVPVYHFGKLVSFVARAAFESMKQKVDTPPFNEQSSYCFNLENIWGRPDVVITEGVFDALTLPEKAVATFGKKISTAQANLLRKSGVKRLTFLYDEDALQESLDFAETYWQTFQTQFAILPDGQDPNSIGREWLRANLEKNSIKFSPGMTLENVRERWYNG